MVRKNIRDIKSGMRLAVPVIDAWGRDLLRAGVILRESLIDRLKTWGVHEIFIEEIASSTQTKEIDRDYTVIFKQTHNKAIECTKQIMRNLETGDSVESEDVKGVVKEMVDRAVLNKDILINLIYLKSYDNYLYTHSVNVCVLSIIIGTYLNYREEQLMELGVGALLHDIGMTQVPKEYYDHPKMVTTEQFEAIKKHTVFGKRLVKDIPGVEESAAEIAYQHHERIDGSGYPKGITGYSIDRYAKIVALANVYEALVSHRQYRKKKVPPEAIRTILSEGEKHFDSKVLRAFLGHMSIYPVGSGVLLNSGEIGIVIETNKDWPFRPHIKIIQDGESGNLKIQSIINLAEKTYSSLYITKTLEENVAEEIGGEV